MVSRSGRAHSPRALRVESLETRTLLSVSAGPVCADNVQLDTAAEISTVAAGEVAEGIVPGEWIVRFDHSDLAGGQKSAELQSLLNDAMANAKWEAAIGNSEFERLNAIPATLSVDQWLWDDGLYSVHTSTAMDGELLESVLAEVPGFKHVNPNVVFQLDWVPDEDTPDDEYYQDGTLWGLNNTGEFDGSPIDYRTSTADADIDAPEAWSTSTGDSDVVVAVIDTGVRYTHVDLDANVDLTYAKNFVADPPTSYVMDDHGHGTHVAGTIGAEGNNDEGVIGVCPDVTILPIKAFNSSGQGTEADIIAAFYYIIDLNANYSQNIRAINCSFGSDTADQDEIDDMQDAMDALETAGILVVAAAGNDHSDIDSSFRQYPAEFSNSNIISVGASDSDDEWAFFSNGGDQGVDLVAPGRDIYSSWASGDTAYIYASGTSMATPHVTGAAALLWSVDPDATVAEVKNAILHSVDTPASLSVNPGMVTDGRLNVAKAIEVIDGEADAPIAESLTLAVEKNDNDFSSNVTAWDPETTSLTYSLVDDAEHGDLTFNSDGSFDYEPDTDWVGYDTFTFRASDGTLQSDVTTVELIVNETGQDWRELQQIEHLFGYTGPYASPRFGSSLAVSDGYMVVSTPSAVWQEHEYGGVFLFKEVPGEGWFYVRHLLADNTGLSSYGYSVAMDGDTIVIGVPNISDATEASSRPVYIIQDTSGAAGDWSTISTTTLTPSDGDDSSHFGESVAIDCDETRGDVIVVGAPGDDDSGNTTDAGKVYAFVKGASGWGSATEIQLTAGSLQADALFGYSVSISGDTIAVGATGEDSERGAVYLFTDTSASDDWSSTTRERLAPASGTGQFGYSVDVSGDTCVVGEPLLTTGAVNTGAGYVIEKGVGGWTGATLNSLTVSDHPASNLLGRSAAISDDESTIVFGASIADSGGGALYVFEDTGFGWTSNVHESKLTGDGVFLGEAVDIDGDSIVGGAPYTENYFGSVFAYERNHGPTAEALAFDVHKNTAIEDQYLAGHDIEGDDLTYSIVSSPSHGTISGFDSSTGEFTYTPTTDYVGEDSFTYRVNDGELNSSTVTVTLSVIPRVTAAGLSSTDGDWDAGTIGSANWASTTIPWEDVDKIVIDFDQAVYATTNEISIVDSASNSVSISSLSGSGTTQLTITLTSALSEEEVYTITLDDAIDDANDNLLDGEMTGVTFPSGDGTAGGDWTFTLTALAGDGTGDGYVSSADLNLVQANWGYTVTPGDRTVGDFHADGVIDSYDLNVVRDNLGAGTPPSAAAAVAPGTVEKAAITASQMAATPTERDSLFGEVADWLDSRPSLDFVSASRSESSVGPKFAVSMTTDGLMVSENAPIEVEIGTADSPAVGDSWAGAFSPADSAPTSEDGYGPQTAEKLRTRDRIFAALL